MFSRGIEKQYQAVMGNLISVIAPLFACSVMEKAWRKSTKYKNIIYV